MIEFNYYPTLQKHFPEKELEILDSTHIHQVCFSVYSDFGEARKDHELIPLQHPYCFGYLPTKSNKRDTPLMLDTMLELFKPGEKLFKLFKPGERFNLTRVIDKDSYNKATIKFIVEDKKNANILENQINIAGITLAEYCSKIPKEIDKVIASLLINF